MLWCCSVDEPAARSNSRGDDTGRGDVAEGRRAERAARAARAAAPQVEEGQDACAARDRSRARQTPATRAHRRQPDRVGRLLGAHRRAQRALQLPVAADCLRWCTCKKMIAQLLAHTL